MLAEEGPQEHNIPVTKWLAINFAREENESWSKGASIPLKHRKARSEGRTVKISKEQACGSWGGESPEGMLRLGVSGWPSEGPQGAGPAQTWDSRPLQRCLKPCEWTQPPWKGSWVRRTLVEECQYLSSGKEEEPAGICRGRRPTREVCAKRSVVTWVWMVAWRGPSLAKEGGDRWWESRSSVLFCQSWGSVMVLLHPMLLPPCCLVQPPQGFSSGLRCSSLCLRHLIMSEVLAEVN